MDDMQQKQIIIEPTIIIKNNTEAGLFEWTAWILIPLLTLYVTWRLFHKKHNDKDKGE